MSPYRYFRQQIECTEHAYFKIKYKINNRIGANKFCKCQARQNLWKKEKKGYLKEKSTIRKPQKIANSI